MLVFQDTGSTATTIQTIILTTSTTTNIVTRTVTAITITTITTTTISNTAITDAATIVYIGVIIHHRHNLIDYKTKNRPRII